MELVIFDLDGTLLNRDSVISAYTSETLKLLSSRQIAYTVATGRTLHGAKSVLDGHRFTLPQAYKNGVMIWHPDQQRLDSGSTLTSEELRNVVEASEAHAVTPFLFTLGEDSISTVYHSPLRTDIERRLIESFRAGEPLRVCNLDELPADAAITHVNCIGDGDAIEAIVHSVRQQPHLVAYSGTALEGQSWRWLDVHHSEASKGAAVRMMKDLLGLERVICFGDSYNDLSMFEAADESYAPVNAAEKVKAAATEVIGHHDEEGIARFLRERFALDALG